MPRPGVTITSRAARSARGDDTSTGTWFVTGFTESGPVGVASRITSLSDYEAVYGGRTTQGNSYPAMLYDSLDLFFQEGGATAYVSRVVGPTTTTSARTLVDRNGTPANTLRIDAAYPGSYGTRLSVAVADGVPSNSYTLTIYLDGNVVEVHSDLLTPGAAVSALATSPYVRAVDLASATAPPGNNPAIASVTALTGGGDNNATATETEWTAALATFAADFGPGQVSAPGRTTLAAQQALISHARLNNRVAYLDVVDSASYSTLIATAAALNAYQGSEYAGLFGSWNEFPALTGTAPRAAPGSSFAAGLTARLDAEFAHAAGAPGGSQGTAALAIGVRNPVGGFTETQQTALFNAGVNMSRAFRIQGVQLYGFESLNRSVDWGQLNFGRQRMSLVHRFKEAGKEYVFRTIDGRGQLFAEFGGRLTGILKGDWELNALYGEEEEDAFFVDTSSAVNTTATINNNELRANVYARFSPAATLVLIDVVKVPVSSLIGGGS